MIAGSAVSIQPQLEILKQRLCGPCPRLRQIQLHQYSSRSADERVQALRAVGVQAGDSVVVHAPLENHQGFRGWTRVANDAFLGSVGAQDNPPMVSIWQRADAACSRSRTDSLTIAGSDALSSSATDEN